MVLGERARFPATLCFETDHSVATASLFDGALTFEQERENELSAWALERGTRGDRPSAATCRRVGGASPRDGASALASLP